MRVALVCETFLPTVNGVTTTLCRLLEHLQEAGHPAILFAPHGAPEFYADTPIVPLGSMPLPFYPEVMLTPPQFGLTAQLARFQPDLVHLVGPVVLGAIVPAVANTLRLPLLSSYHTDFGSYSRHYGFGWLRQTINAYLRWVHNRCGVTLCPSSATLRDLRALGFRRLRVWGRGVDTRRFHPKYRSEAWREAVGLQPDESLLLYVGRLAREKRIDLLAEAIRGMEGVRLIIVGDGPARAELQHLMADLPAHFTGYLRGERLATAYASADVFMFPSDTETFGQVVQEAMASGLPVVGARGGGTLDLVQAGRTGLLFQPGAGDDLRAQLRVLLADANTRGTMGQAGRAHAELHSWPVVMDELMSYYRRALRFAPGNRRAL